MGKVIVKYRNKKVELEGPLRVEEILKQFNLLPEYVVVSINGEIVTEKEMARPGDEVLIVSAISGGSGAM